MSADPCSFSALWWVAALGIQPRYLQDAVSLEQAARVLLDSDGNDAKLKTKIRRLYDIANIFGSLRMVRFHPYNTLRHSQAQRSTRIRCARWNDEPNSELRMLHVRRSRRSSSATLASPHFAGFTT